MRPIHRYTSTGMVFAASGNTDSPRKVPPDRDQRSGFERRSRNLEPPGVERRSGADRRVPSASGPKLRIPIFIKLVILATLLIGLVVSSISYLVLDRQKKQLTNQLISLGNSMVRIISENAPDKLLGEEDLALLKLVTDIAEDEQVQFALITDWKGIIRAHSRMEAVGNPFQPPKQLKLLNQTDGIVLSTFFEKDEALLYFEKVLTYQQVPIGKVYLAISQKQIQQNFARARFFIIVLTLVALGLGVTLSFLFSLYFSGPIRKLQEGSKAIGTGDLDHRVRIRRNDEFGDLGSAFNRMAAGLKERERMRQSLNLAKDVQQNLLPKSTPRVPGLDIAGKSIFCDETGGDYYDYLHAASAEKGRIGVVIGDVTGHGIPAALLMATARAFLRQLSADQFGQPERTVSMVNRHLTHDVQESGRFMTLFYLTVDTGKNRLAWVRAGHDPAIFYDPVEDRFDELRGSGMALGVDEESSYEINHRTDLQTGQIILLSTDGLWEALNPQGEMFGKDAIYDILRRNRSAGASQILDAILSSLTAFQGGIPSEDDVTMVVIKFK